MDVAIRSMKRRSPTGRPAMLAEDANSKTILVAFFLSGAEASRMFTAIPLTCDLSASVPWKAHRMRDSKVSQFWPSTGCREAESRPSERDLSRFCIKAVQPRGVSNVSTRAVRRPRSVCVNRTSLILGPVRRRWGGGMRLAPTFRANSSSCFRRGATCNA